MCGVNNCCVFNAFFITVIVVLAIWDLTWKFIAMWKAARNNHLAWFICIAIFNTVGILPIIYILTCGKKSGGENLKAEAKP